MGIGDIISQYREAQGLSPNEFVSPRDAMQWSQSRPTQAVTVPVIGESRLPGVEVQRAVASYQPPTSLVSVLDSGYQDYVSRSNRMRDLAGGNQVFPEIMTGNFSQSPAMRQQWYEMGRDNPQTASIMKNKVNQLRQAYVNAAPEQREGIVRQGTAARNKLEGLLQQNVERLAAREATRPERPFPVADYYLGKGQDINYSPRIQIEGGSVPAGQTVSALWSEVNARNMAPQIGAKETMTYGKIPLPDDVGSAPGAGYRPTLTSQINPIIDRAVALAPDIATIDQFRSQPIPGIISKALRSSDPGPADALSFTPQYAAQGRSSIAVPGREVSIHSEYEPVATPTTVRFNQAAPAVEAIDPAVGEAARRNFYAGKETYESLLPSITQQVEVGPGARMTRGEVQAADALDQMVEAGNFIKGRGTPDTRDYSVLQPVQPYGDTEKLSDVIGRRNLMEQQSRLQSMGQPGFTPTEVLQADPRVEALRNRVIQAQAFNDDLAGYRSDNAGMNAANRMYDISNAKYDQADAIARAKNDAYAARSAFQEAAEQSAARRAMQADSLRNRAQALLTRKGMTRLAV